MACENECLRAEDERRREESEFDLAFIQIDADVIRCIQHAEIIILEGTLGETLLSSTMNKETQANGSQLARYHEIMSAEVDGVRRVRRPSSPLAVPRGGIVDGPQMLLEILPQIFEPVDASQPVVDSLPCADSDRA